jgi:glyoxylase-like metal-dependent hydrolase (beta-lactamase superfamily II)
MTAMELRVGDRTMVCLRDGDFIMPDDFLGLEAHRQLADPDGQVRLPIGCFLVPGDEPLLIDAGIGPDLKLDILVGGALVDELASVGVQPADIRHIALSHLHADHIGWIATKEGGITFPNAHVYVADDDWEHFLVERHDPRPVPWVRAAFDDLANRGQLTILDGERQLVRGVTALPAPGHTPGHTVYVVHDHDDRAVLFGDAVYCPQQLTEVDWEATSDVDPVLSRRTRERLWREVEDGGGLVVGPHFPGLRAGRVLSSAWVPAT